MDTSEKILIGARNYLLKYGQFGFTVRSVAKEAGVNHGLVHHYFGSKENMLLKLMDYEFGQVDNALCFNKIQGCENGIPNKLITEVVDHPDRFKLIVEFHYFSQHFDSVKEKVKEIILIRREQIASLFGIKDEIDKKLFQAVFLGSMIQSGVDPDVDVVATLNRMLKLLGLKVISE